jgi:phage tail sheath protein FI
MAATYRTPGVYIEEIPRFPPSVAAVATAIPAFIGHTEMATFKGEDLKNKPTRISSLVEYQTRFGYAPMEKGLKAILKEKTVDGKRESIEVSKVDIDKPSPFVMYYALQAYFSNGGGPCWIVSVGPYPDDGIPKKKPLDEGLQLIEKEDEPTLIVFPEAQGLDAVGEHFPLIVSALAQCAKLKDRFVIADLHVSGKDMKDGEVRGALTDADKGFRSKVGGSDLKYGAVYFPNIETIFDYNYDDADVTIVHYVDDAEPPDGTYNDKRLQDLQATEGVVYAAIERELRLFPVTIPPSGAIAGVYARVDDSRGVWKAPANVLVRDVSGLTYKVTEDLQDELNIDSTAGKSINAIRAFAGRGILVWGSRTLDGNSNEWRYVPVRRFFNMVEESTKKATARFVFEPNDANTWVKVRAMIENFLRLQWRAGALQGDKPEKAFFVKVGLGETMTALDILEGRMIVEIGMAVVRPAEFIILRFMHKLPES